MHSWHVLESLLCCFQTEECMTVLKKLSSAEAECVVERLTSWARLQLEDKVHISDEVRRRKMLVYVKCIQIASRRLHKGYHTVHEDILY